MMGSVSPRCRLHCSPLGSSSRADPRGWGGPVQHGTGHAEFHMHVRTEVETEADNVAAAFDLGVCDSRGWVNLGCAAR
jgi:hypothetical protein